MEPQSNAVRGPHEDRQAGWDQPVGLRNLPQERGAGEWSRRKAAEGQKKFDVNATPTFIIDDDHKIVGAEPYEEFEKILLKKVQ